MKKLKNMITKEELKKAKSVLENSGIIAFPTETVMGLGVFYDDRKAYDFLNSVKRRPEDKPYTLMLGNVADISKYAYLSNRDRIIVNAFMPGELTILLNSKSNVPGYVTHNTNIIGIRVPAFDDVCALINYVGKPLLVPSANRSGEKPFMNYSDVENEFKNEVGFVKKQNAVGGKPSTIIDLTGKEIKIIREGNLTLEQITRRVEFMKKIAVGSDHGGFEYKNEIVKYLVSKNYEVIDCGTYSSDSCHYPDFGKNVAELVSASKADYGIVICTSGEGIMIAANKIHGIRCGLGYNDEVTALLRMHNDANMIAFGQKFMTLDDIKKRIDIFLNTSFEGGRHQTRVSLINDLEK